MATSESQSAVLDIEKLVYGGDGLARHDGQVVLLPYVLPGERVQAELYRYKNDLLAGTLETVEQASPERTAPPCPYFTTCGGCHLQHASPAYQLQQKVVMLREVLQRVGRLEVGEIQTRSAEPLGYRNRAQFHFAQDEMGYLEMGSHQLVPIDHCPISSPRINEVIQALRGMMKERKFPRFLKELEVFTDEEAVQINVLKTDRPMARSFFDWCEERIGNIVPGALDYAVGSRLFRVSYKSFFQVNRFLIDTLVAEALRDFHGKFALDLYAGVGLFTLPLAERFDRVIAVETGTAAIRDLEYNIALGGIEAEAQRAPAEEVLAGSTEAPDFILADPPRAGLQKQVVQELLRLKPMRIAIVSCDPATLSRDLAKLVEGGYAVQRMTLVDLFPQTYHLETVTHLQLR